LDTSKVKNMGNMFYRCMSLVELPNLDMSSNSRVSRTFWNTLALKSIVLPTLPGGITDNGEFIINCWNLQKLVAPIDFDFSVENGKMTAEALNEMFEALPSVTDKTVTITGNPGANDCDTTIATNKGWTVVV